MARVSTSEIQGWLEVTKLTISSPNTELLSSLEEEVLVRLSARYTTTSWVDTATTPKIVRVIISKMYAAWHIDKQYSENQSEDGNAYANRLTANAEMLISGIIDGVILIPEQPKPNNANVASFYPTDASSALTPTPDNLSLGPARFSLGKSF